MSFKFYYGDFIHPDCEVYPSRILIRPLHSQRGIRWASNYRMEIAGDLVQVGATLLTPSEISSRISAIDAAYLNDYKDCGFLLNDAATPHTLLTDSTDNLSGNRIVFRSWDNALPTEYANTRSFSVAIEAVFRESYSDIIDFQERTMKIGTGGPEWRLYKLATGDPVKEEITDKTPVRHVTTGRIVSMTGFVVPPEPYWPNEEMEWLRTITYDSPQMHGHPDRKYTHYVTSYRYVFHRLGPDPMTSFNTWYIPAT